jgi:pimeloyl-ACP methyl ester carboxylesterase
VVQIRADRVARPELFLLIDEDRIVIRGFSLGGATAWHLTAHYAADWAASAPGAGFSETRDFLTGFQGEELHPPWWEEKLWQLYDSPAYVENFRNVPLVAYSGEIDRQKQAADVMAKSLRRHRHRAQAHHRSEHRARLPSRTRSRRSNALIDPLAARGRETLPRTITVTTPR